MSIAEFEPYLPTLLVRAWETCANLPGWFWGALYFSWLISAMVFILLQRRPPAATLAWMIGFLSLPVLGALVYFFFGPRKLKRRHVRRALAKELAAQSVPVTSNQLSQPFLDQFNLASIARVAMSREDPGPVRSTSLELLVDGDCTYDAIERTMAAAQSQIHLEYYIFEPDVIGTRWRDLLVEHASAGVTVRVLLDAIGSANCTSEFWAPLIKVGGEVRYFNPVRIFKPKPGKLNFRTHRKIVVIDGRIGFTGGINITADNSALSCGSDAWRDTHLRVDGPPTHDLQVIFLEDWLYANDSDSPWLRPDRAEISRPEDARQWFPRMSGGQGPWVQIVDSGPDEETPDIHRFFFSAITQAKHRVWITTPYFVPDESMVTALVTASNRGVDVRLMTPVKGDSRLVTAAASTYADEVARDGVKVHCYGPPMTHAKTMVIDDELSIVGTANMDNRSFRLNFEVVAAVYDRPFNQQLADVFEKDLDSCKRMDIDQIHPGFLQRLLASGARLFAPLL